MLRNLRHPRFGLALGVPLLALLAACGGGGGGGSSSSGVTNTLVFTPDPTATASDWRIEADPATNGTQTVTLRVYGPTGATVQGTTVFLTCNTPSVSWVKPSGATDPYALPGSALDLTQGPNVGVQLFKSRRAGTDLQVAAYQKTGTSTLTASEPLFSVALDLSAGVEPGPVDLAETTGKSALYLDAGGEHACTLKVGTLTVE